MSEEEEDHDDTKGGIDLHVLRRPYFCLTTERYRDPHAFLSHLDNLCRFPKYFEDFCATITKCFAIKKDVNDLLFRDHPTWTSVKVLKALGKNTLNQRELRRLRSEDTTHVPKFCIDRNEVEGATIITDWNRSMTDLTGIARSEVVGRKYEDMLLEWIPSLSDEYRTESLKFISTPLESPKEKITVLSILAQDSGRDFLYDKVTEERLDKFENGENPKPHYKFPLPLPLRQDFKDVDERYNDYVELLIDGEIIDDCHDEKSDGDSRWISGTAFILRRKLRSSVAIVDDHMNNNGDGNTTATATAANTSDPNTDMPKNALEDDSSTTKVEDEVELDNISTVRNSRKLKAMLHDICTKIKSSRPSTVKYMREVLFHLRDISRKSMVSNKHYIFSKDWTKNIEDDNDENENDSKNGSSDNGTAISQLNKLVIQALGGDSIVKQNRSSKNGNDTYYWSFLWCTRQKNKAVLQQRKEWISSLSLFLDCICPIVGRVSPTVCDASDTSIVIPYIEDPDRTILTLKILVTRDSDGIGSWAIVQVPSTLNFFQLHRVVSQTINCSPSCTNETHVWKVKNLASKNDGDHDAVEIGEVYKITEGLRVERQATCFPTGNFFRQQVSETGAYIDQKAPFYSLPNRYDSFPFVGKLYASIHSTCICSLFFKEGAVVSLQDGYGYDRVEFDISCVRIGSYLSPIPKTTTNTNINAFLPRCIRRKNQDGGTTEEANEQLFSDRGCLRRNFCKINSRDCLQRIPWCHAEDPCRYRNRDEEYTGPIATTMRGLDGAPMYILGEPPMPANDSEQKYMKHLSSINLDDSLELKFLPERVVDEYGSFSVPFGKRAKIRNMFGKVKDFRDNDKEEGEIDGLIWEREADEADSKILLLTKNDDENKNDKKRLKKKRKISKKK